MSNIVILGAQWGIVGWVEALAKPNNLTETINQQPPCPI